jgi:methylated-DNA-[protein]-cysteine S-methyltransferase
MTRTATMTATTSVYLDTTDSPAGPIAFAVNESGALVRLSFREGHYPRTLEEDLLADGYELATDVERTAPVRKQLEEYLAGTRQAFDVPLAPSGTAWQLAVWEALRRIPYGQTQTYGQLAAALGRPAASRAVGRANGTNPIPLVVPCHRVIGADGTLTGFGGGLHLKTRLLAHEARVSGQPLAAQLVLLGDR